MPESIDSLSEKDTQELLEINAQKYFETLQSEFGLAINVLKKRDNSPLSNEEYLTDLLQEYREHQSNFNKVLENVNLEKLEDFKNFLAEKIHRDTGRTDLDKSSLYRDKLALLALGKSGREDKNYEEIKKWLTTEDGSYDEYTQVPIHQRYDLRYSYSSDKFDADTFKVLEKLGKTENLNPHELYYFKSLPGSLADGLIDQGNSFVARSRDHFGKFESLSKKVANSLIAHSEPYQIISAYERFEGIDPIFVLKNNIESSRSYHDETEVYIRFIEREVSDVKVRKEMLQMLIGAGYEVTEEIIKKLLPNSEGEDLLEVLKNKDEILGKALDEGWNRFGYSVYLPKPDEQGMEEVIKAGFGPLMVTEIWHESRPGVDWSKIAKLLNKRNEAWVLLKEDIIDRNDQATIDFIAEEMIKNGDASVLCSYLSQRNAKYNFNNTVARELINQGFGEIVASNLNNFPSVKVDELIDIMDSQYGDSVFTNIYRYNLDKEDIEKLLNKGLEIKNKRPKIFSDFFRNEETLTDNLRSLEENGYLATFVENIERFINNYDQISSLYFIRSLNVLPLTSRKIAAQKLVDLGFTKKIIEALSQTSRQYNGLELSINDLTVNISASEIDNYIEEDLRTYPVFLEYRGAPEGSFYLKNIKLLQYFGTEEENQKLQNNFVHYMRQGAIEKSSYSIELLIELQERFPNLNNLSTLEKCFKGIYPFKSRVKRRHYMDIFEQVLETPSQELKRIQNEVIDQITDAADPGLAYKEIEKVFIENNLPLFWKVHKIFDILHSDTQIKNDLKDKGSRVLIHASPEERRVIIYKDLLRTHIASGNRSLKKYLQAFESGQKIFDKAESQGWESLSLDELEESVYVFKKLETFSNNTSEEINPIALSQELPLDLLYQKLREDLGAKEGQRILDRFSELFLKPIDLDTIDELRSEMITRKDNATDRNKKYAKEINKKHDPNLKQGDFLKGTDSAYISNILQNGSVAKEFLGGSANKDQTPFDTDVSLILAKDEEGGLENILKNTMASGYGDIRLGFRNRGQYSDMTDIQEPQYEPNLLEIFNTGGERHYGIRTGIPSTEIDFVLVEKGENTSKIINRLKLEIAKNAFYIPIINNEGDLLYAPDEYEKYRLIFAGVNEYEGSPLPIKNISERDELKPDVENLVQEKNLEIPVIKNLSLVLKSQIKEALIQTGLTFRGEFDTSILGSEFHDTGSTSRATNILENYDFDFNIRLDEKNFIKASQFADVLVSSVQAFEVLKEAHEGGYYQVRAKGVTTINGVTLSKPVDLDVGFGNKSDEVVYGSHNAVADKLASIEIGLGKDTTHEVVANIVLAKQILKDAGCYKKTEEGGLGGIGVENWILQNNGNIRDAFQSFYDAAHTGSEITRFEEIRERYPIIDAGFNIKFGRHDNFMYNLSESGYKKMIQAIERFL